MDHDYGRIFLKRPILLILATIFVFIVSFSCNDPNWTPKTPNDRISQIFFSIRSNLQGIQTSFPEVKAKGFLIAIYDGKGNRKTAAGVNLENTCKVLLNKSKDIDIISSYITLTIISDISKIRIETSSKLSLTYTKGIDGIAYSRKENVSVLDPPFIAARDYDFNEVKEKLKKGEGVNIKGLNLSHGFYKVVCESFTEAAPGQMPVPLYRANVLFDKVTPDLIEKAIRDGGDMLVRLQRGDGRFYYEYFPGNDDLNRNDYNLLRHAGTCYSLFSLYGATKDEKYLLAGRRGIDWLLKQMKTPAWDIERAYPVYHKKAKLGGAGLSLMALCERVKVDPEYDISPIMHKLANHLRREQKSDGSFHTYYSWDKKPVKKRFSIYYPGEAMLALIRYNALVPEGSKESVAVVEKGADFLIDKRWKLVGMNVNIPPDAWLMMALHEVYLVSPKEKYVDYCLKIAQGMASDQILTILPGSDYYGGFFPFPPQVTPAGSRSEGLTAAYYLAEKAGRPNDWIAEIIRRGAIFQIRMQIRPEFAHLFKNPKMALGTFRHSPTDSRNRIDYNQHNISGLIFAAKILETGE